MSKQAIVLNQLTKHYGTHRGVENLSFSVNEGEFSASLAQTVQENPPPSVL